MRATVKFILLFFINTLPFFCLAQSSPQTPFQEKVASQEASNNLEAFVYTYLDEYLKQPVYDKLYLFDLLQDYQWRVPVTRSEHLALTIFYSNAGYYNMQFNKVEKSIEMYEKAWTYYREYEFKEFDIIEYCLKPLGNAYSMLGDYHSAENIIKSYLLQAAKTGRKKQQIAALINLSIVYHNTGKNNEAVHVLEKALTFEENSDEKRGYIYSNLAKSYLQLEELENAEAYARKALNFFADQAAEQKHNLSSVYSMLSVVRLHQHDTTAAIDFLDKAMLMAQESKSVSTRQESKIITQYAHLLGATNRFEEAFNNYKLALSALLPDYQYQNDLPKADQLYAENTFKEIFDGMAEIFVQQGLLKKAIACYEKSFAVEENLKATFNYYEAKHLHQNENRNRAERVIDLWQALYQAEKEDSYLEEAFLVAERTKSIALKDELYNRQAWKESGNDSLFTAKMKLSQKKSRIESDLIHEKQKEDEADINKIQRLLSEQNAVIIKLKNLERSFKTELVEKQKININYLQSDLARDKITLIEYFFGNSSIYTFILDGQKIRLEVNNQADSLREKVIQFTQLFSDPVKITAAPELFAERASSLYRTLIPSNCDSNLLIVPDGMLNFIPFESLLSSEVSIMDDFMKWPWLIKKSSVFYQYSAALYTAQRSSQTFDSKQVLGFFPYTQKSDRYLKYSLDEKEVIEKQFKGDFYVAENATKTNFLINAHKYPIVHLSTHAKAGTVNDPPAIFFFDQPMYLPEVYGLDLYTELLVLGACETGLGKLYKGEGPLSLAGGFAFAGVKNILLSLWKVNDYSTSRLMFHFYNNYKKQPRAYMALHKAKLDYLKDESIASESKSPYYWASFIYYGGTDVY